MPLEDKATRRRVEHEISKHTGLDITLLNVAVINHVAYLSGRVKRLKGSIGAVHDIRKEMALIVEACLQLPGITDVVMDAQIDL
jgi:osmotically-inducible protein OsmY